MDMSYNFRISDRLSAGARRIGLEQIDAATVRLASGKEPAKIVHETRKTLKKLRSLLRLVKPALASGVYERENVRYRDIGRSLSEARDATVLFETLERLHEGADGRIKATLGSVQTRLRRAIPRNDNRPGAEDKARRKPLSDDPGSAARTLLEATKVKFAEARAEMKSLPFEDEGMSAAFDGVEHVYRRARKAMSVAFDTLEAEDLHEFRKATQHHWRHMQLVGLAWPEYFDARVKTARHLSQVLGEDHDLAALIAFVSVGAGRQALTERQSALVEGIAGDRQAELREQAHALGRRLFDEPPSAFRHHVAFYWRTARDEAPFAAAAE